MTRKYLVNIYLNYIDNYLTIAEYAEHNGLTTDKAHKLLSIAEEVFNSDYPEE